MTVAAVALLSAAAAGATAWWLLPKPQAVGHEPKKLEADADKKALKYITLDKVIVMLRRGPNETEAHYMSADLVLATPLDKERHTKEHLPLLRSIAVRALSGYTMAAASQMTVEQFAEQLNKTFNASYAKDRIEKPFSEVMIGKLIIE
ncbi:MAG: flagellar basal body-associated FliL family protein [Massilia sp.]